jgi:hypothetical protein
MSTSDGDRTVSAPPAGRRWHDNRPARPGLRGSDAPRPGALAASPRPSPRPPPTPRTKAGALLPVTTSPKAGHPALWTFDTAARVRRGGIGHFRAQSQRVRRGQADRTPPLSRLRNGPARAPKSSCFARYVTQVGFSRRSPASTESCCGGGGRGDWTRFGQGDRGYRRAGVGSGRMN